MIVTPVPFEPARFWVSSERPNTEPYLVDFDHRDEKWSRPKAVCGCYQMQCKGETTCKHVIAAVKSEAKRLGMNINMLEYMKPRKRIPRRSKRRMNDSRAYAKVGPQFLRSVAICIRCKEYIPLGERTIHHYFGRTNELLYWVPGFRMACLPCHEYIEHHRNESVELGFRAPDNLFGRPSLVIPNV